MKKRIRSRAGESIAETLVAVLIISLAFLMLAGAVTAAARVNEGIKNEKQSFQFGTAAGKPTVELSITGGTLSFSDDVEVQLYKKETDGFTYYHYEKTT